MSNHPDQKGLESLKQVLQLTFEQNMSVLKQHFPQFYKRFLNYQPEAYGLDLDQNGFLNIACNGQFIYDGDPQKISREQFEFYSQAPTRSVYQLNIKKDDNTEDMFAHIGLLKKLAMQGNDAIARAASHPVYVKPDYYPIMCVIGVGIGYQLEYLTNEDIGHLHVYEPNPDLFYASLFVVNYKALVQKFTENNRRLSLVIGMKPEQYIEEVHKSLMESGTYQAAMLPVYKTYSSATVDEALERFLDASTNFYSGFGFVEDEIISINHTMANLKNKIPFVPANLSYLEYNDKPVFICGSGPSLDDSLEFLLENREKINLFSCGSSLSPLYKAGLVPDLHFEIERTEELFNWVAALGDAEYFSKISLVTMNTVSPMVIGLFGNAYVYMKPNDGGTDLLRSIYREKSEEAMLLFASNPTVTNAATAFAAKTGLNELYFVGMDLGFKDESYHHSKSSVYYKKDDDTFGQAYAKVRGGLKQVEGNFGGTVFTTGVFDWARHSIEYVLRRPQYQHINAYNCSDGAAIFRAKPTKLDEVQISSTKSGNLAEKLKQESLAAPFSAEVVAERVKKSSELLINGMQFLGDKKFTEATFELRDLMMLFQYQFNTIFNLMTKQDLFAGRVLIGSLNYLHSATTGKMYTIRSEEERIRFSKEAIDIFVEYFETMESIYREKVLAALETEND